MIIADVTGIDRGRLFIDQQPRSTVALYTLMVTQFVLSAVFTPARNAALANYVAQEDLVTANAIDSATWSSMLALGALIGGTVAQYSRPKLGFPAGCHNFYFRHGLSVVQCHSVGHGWHLPQALNTRRLHLVMDCVSCGHALHY